MLSTKSILTIVDLLKACGYKGLSLDSDWNKSMLLSNTPERKRIIVWILFKLEILECDDAQIHDERILEEFVHLGLCKTQDIQLIQGSRTETEQCDFFLRILKHLQMFLQKNNHGFPDHEDYSLNRIIMDPCIRHHINAEEVNFLEPQIYSKYRQKLEKGSLKSQEQHIQEQESSLINKEGIEIVSCPDYDTKICQELLNMKNMSDELVKVFQKLHEPWIKSYHMSDPINDETGELLRKNNDVVQKVLKLNQDKKAAMEKFDAVRGESHPRTDKMSSLNILSEISC